ncbi:MAG: hypothetical protein KKA55_01945 [Proteobacteria bacterium]|nr:hypothetical protein [Pseudomonadota bacterium]MBU1594281.1 hypothetical protein [Pseudomonadota bacterium]
MAQRVCPDCKRNVGFGIFECPICKRSLIGVQFRALPLLLRGVLITCGVVLAGLFLLAVTLPSKPTPTMAPAPPVASPQRTTHTEAQLEAALAAVKKRDKVLSVAWNNKSLPSLLVGVNGAGKVPGAFDSFARGICGALAAEGINGAFVHVLDNDASGWVELGKAECP